MLQHMHVCKQQVQCRTSKLYFQNNFSEIPLKKQVSSYFSAKRTFVIVYFPLSNISSADRGARMNLNKQIHLNAKTEEIK